MIAFHGDPKIKAFYLNRIRQHCLADELVKGQYWKNGRGCGIGCTIHSGSHVAYETDLGIPQILARLEDVTFERLENGEAMLWPERFLATIPVGADLSLVWPRYAVWMLGDTTHGVLRHAKTERMRLGIRGVLDLYQEWVDLGMKPDAKRFSAAYDAYAAYATADACRAWWLASAAKLLELLGHAPVVSEAKPSEAGAMLAGKVDVYLGGKPKGDEA